MVRWLRIPRVMVANEFPAWANDLEDELAAKCTKSYGRISLQADVLVHRCVLTWLRNLKSMDWFSTDRTIRVLWI